MYYIRIKTKYGFHNLIARYVCTHFCLSRNKIRVDILKLAVGSRSS